MGKLFPELFFWILIFSIFFLMYIAGAVEPFGASVNPGIPGRAPNDTPVGVAAWAGNVTQLDIGGYSSTQSWQGYYGNVTGTITLSDSGDNVMYNWSLASPRGEVFASTNSSITWNSVQCFNFTASGNTTAFNATEVEKAGATNLGGLNASVLEARFGINSSDVDGVNETFVYTGAEGHEAFYVNNLEFSHGECINTRVYDNSGHGVDGNFEEVLLFEPASSSVIFTALLERDLAGFDKASHDFEMIVLEDGHGTNTDATTYFFYVELE